jgi:hypothetical protein
MVSHEVHGLIGVLGIYGFSYLAVAVASKEICCMPVITFVGNEQKYETAKIYALTEVKLYPFLTPEKDV